MTKQSGRSDYEMICGLNPVKEALRARRVKELYISETRKKGLEEILELSKKANITVKWVENSFFDVRFQKGHQSVAALVKKKKVLDTGDLLKKIESRESALVIILDEIEDPRNLGAILRVADAAGADGVVIQKYRQAGISPEVIKSSAGAYEYVDIVMENNIKYSINAFKKEGFTIIGADIKAEKNLWQVDLRGKIGLIMGSEGRGIRETVLKLCDEIVFIPMLGKVNSLNVSVATGIIVFEALRQRMI
ncbi:MAG: 23S rRNA (guanosine(2251)-2'-O)-methyltransferase RlmB [Thermodesulfovibrionales bacterium]|nr:23S rRNA (guanosine(2251)-2'-O)-methyltransferase RlmB [Thermodesulfovibrionales bacterium]